MRRTLYFYDVLLEKHNSHQPNFLSPNNSPSMFSNLKDKVHQLSEEHTADDLIYRDETSVIQILDFNEDFIFGSFGRIEDLSEKSLTRGRNKDSFEIKELDQLQELIESYTYYYMDLNTNKCIILHNPNVTAFKSKFSNFLLQHFRVSAIYQNITIVNTISDDIDTKVKHANKFATVSYSYTSDKLPSNEFANFKEMAKIRDDQINKAVVQLYLKPGSDYGDMSKSLSNRDNYIDNFSTLTVETQNETIDIVEKILSKKVSIKIDEDKLDAIDHIKQVLQTELANY